MTGIAARFCSPRGRTAIAAAAIWLLSSALQSLAVAAEDLLPAGVDSDLLLPEGVRKIDAMLDAEVAEGYIGGALLRIQAGWGGAAGTYFWAYPKQNMVMLFMVQTPTQRGRIQPILKTLVFRGSSSCTVQFKDKYAHR